MKPPLVSPKARADLSDIWDHTASRWGQAQAVSYTPRIAAAFDLLASDPRAGRRCDDIRVGYRRYEVGSHIIFYRLKADAIEIVRVLQARMDVAKRLR